MCAVRTVERQPIRVTTRHQRLGKNDLSKMTIQKWKHGSTLLMRIEAESLQESSNGPLRSARVDSNASNANSRNNESTSAHLSSPSNLLPGACPIKFFCLSAYSRAIIEQWTS